MKKPVRLAVAARRRMLIMALTALGNRHTGDSGDRRRRADRIVDIPALSRFDRVIDPDDYECEPTAIDTYVDEQIASWTPAELQFVIPHQDALFGVPTYAPLFFGTDGGPDLRAGLARRPAAQQPSGTSSSSGPGPSTTACSSTTSS